MPEVTSSTRAIRAATTVGFATALIGSALVVAPTAAGPLMRLTQARGARIVGIADLVLVPGLLVGRPRWPWTAARATLNVIISIYVLRLSSTDDQAGQQQARVVAGALAAATIADSVTTAALRGSR